MWTIEARELMLQSINGKTSIGSTLVLFDSAQEIARIEILAPASKIENGALIFSESEVLAEFGGTPTRAEVWADNILLLNLSVPEDLQIDPVLVVPGALIRIKSLVIQ